MNSIIGLIFKRLTPHLLAIEAHKQAALTRVLPPQWRESSLEQGVAEATDEKQQLHIRNLANARAWVNERFAAGTPPLTLADLMTMNGMVADGATGDYVPGALRSLAVQVGRREVGGLHMGSPDQLAAAADGPICRLHYK